MSSRKYASPLLVDIIPSRWLLVAMLVLHVGAMSLVALTSLSIAIKVGINLLIITEFTLVLLRFGWCTTWFSIAIPMMQYKSVEWDDNDQWLLRDQDNQEHAALLLPGSYVHPYLVIVNLRLLNKSWFSRNVYLVFLPDNIDRELFRRLRIRLRWYSNQVPDNSVA